MRDQRFVIARDVVSNGDVIWKDIPGFSRYQASSEGRVRYNDKQNRITRLCNRYEIKTSVGTYIRVSAVSDDHRYRSKEEHRLVCLAFHGLPPDTGKVYDTNHIDGNKHNNRPENLEWTTRSENLTHAYRTGLRKNNVPVTVIDHQTGVSNKYYSIGEVSRVLGIPHKTMIRIVNKHTGNNKYLDRFTFLSDFSNHKPTQWAHVRDLMAYDYVNKRTLIADSSAVMQHLTKINRETILYNVTHGNVNLVGGFVFTYLSSNFKFPEYTGDEIQASIDAYFNKCPAREKIFGVKVKNYLTDEIVIYDTFAEASEKTNINKGTIAYLLGGDKNRLFKGYWFKYMTDPTDFPVFDKEFIDVSVRINKPEFPIIQVTDLELDTTKLYASVAEFAREKGFNPVSVANALRLNPSRPYDKRYRVTRMHAPAPRTNSSPL